MYKNAPVITSNYALKIKTKRPWEAKPDNYLSTQKAI